MTNYNRIFYAMDLNVVEGHNFLGFILGKKTYITFYNDIISIPDTALIVFF